MLARTRTRARQQVRGSKRGAAGGEAAGGRALWEQWLIAALRAHLSHLRSQRGRPGGGRVQVRPRERAQAQAWDGAGHRGGCVCWGEQKRACARLPSACGSVRLVSAHVPCRTLPTQLPQQPPAEVLLRPARWKPPSWPTASPRSLGCSRSWWRKRRRAWRRWSSLARRQRCARLQRTLALRAAPTQIARACL